MSDQTPSTFGWDTASAIRVDDANAEIARQGSSPTTFNASSDDGSTIDGTFGTWQIESGDGEIVNLRLPITAATLSSGGTTTPFSGTAHVEVRLVYLKADPAPTTGGPTSGQPATTGTSTTGTPTTGTTTAPATDPATTDPPAKTGPHDLKVNATDPEATSLTGIDYDDPPGFSDDMSIQTCFQNWLNANIGDFDHVFVTVDLAHTAAVAGFQWLQPVDPGYAYVKRTGDVDLIGVLAMTGTGTASGKTAELAPGVIPSGARAGLLISPARLLDQVIRKALLVAFPGTQDADYAVSVDGLELTLPAPVKLAQRTDSSGGHSYTHTPTLESLTVRFEGERITIDCTTQTTITPGIFSNGHYYGVYQVALVNRKDGTQTLTFSQDPTADTICDHWTTMSEAFTYVDYVVMAAGLIALIVLSILTDGVALLLAGMAIALLQGVWQVTPKLIALENEDDAPAIDPLVIDAAGAITWPGASSFKLTYVDLAGGLRLGGDPGFTSTGTGTQPALTTASA